MLHSSTRFTDSRPCGFDCSQSIPGSRHGSTILETHSSAAGRCFVYWQTDRTVGSANIQKWHSAVCAGHERQNRGPVGGAASDRSSVFPIRAGAENFYPPKGDRLMLTDREKLLSELKAIERWDSEYYRQSIHSRTDRDAFLARQIRRKELLILLGIPKEVPIFTKKLRWNICGISKTCQSIKANPSPRNQRIDLERRSPRRTT